MVCTKIGVTRVVSTQISILRACLAKQGNIKSDPKLSEYAGSLFSYNGLSVVFIDPLPQLFTVSYGKFLAKRYISKVVAKDRWSEATKFTWKILDEKTIDAFYLRSLLAYARADDIETLKDPLKIKCLAFTCVFIDPKTGIITTDTGVLPITSIWAVQWMRKFCDTKTPKIFQNGKYDCSYLLMYNSPPRNYIWDTAHGMHSWYSELPKDLAFQNAFFLREVVYWKDLAESSDLYEYYRYNGLDTWATANVWIQQMLFMPDWARRNYYLEFPLVFPCILAEMTGVRRDSVRLEEEREKVKAREAAHMKSLTTMIGQPLFNPGSPNQVKQLMRVLGEKDPSSSDEDHLKALSYAHPLNGRILGEILKIREVRKLRTTYLRTEDDITKTSKQGSKDFRGRILYSLNPHHTKTGRLASSDHHFWTGFNIQNIPTGPEVKRTIVAEAGFYIAECDLEQAESRDTAYISGDVTLIEAVTSPRDFHSVNASAFFGIPYSDLYDDERKKTKNKPIRDTSKRTNHGANYNMGDLVLVDTMGLEAVYEAKKLLKLPFNEPREVGEYLLCRFHMTYRSLRGMIATRSKAVREFLGIDQSEYKLYAPGTYYASISNEIRVNSSITSRAFHHTDRSSGKIAKSWIDKGDWTRYCFGSPWANKLDLNSYAAHPSQSLNARTLNEAWLDVFYKIALEEPDDFRLCAQIHDSILFQWRAGRDDLPRRVRELMEIKVSVRNVAGVMMEFTVPAALKIGKKLPDGSYEYAKYWSDTE
jgi:DNA polymerase I-like protein with 3'-5' exonuclease and polymerase domains